MIGTHRAPASGGPSRGYLLTVALLAGTASMPILAAISAGSATMGNSAPPDASTRFIPTPSVGPVVLPLPDGTQPPALPSRTPATTDPPGPALAPAVPALPDDWDLGSHRRSRPAVSAPTINPVRPTPPASPSPPRPPTPSPPATEPATPDPWPSPPVEPTSTFSEPATDPPVTSHPEPTATDSAGPSPPAGVPTEPPASTCSPTAGREPSATMPAAAALG
ncbi:hypothetical protein AB0C02_02940 [Micromonospora sp. NPDC048999]|uniref:hypothetical protein n=1 Tax=Micromonospora sp. NPDC048999 TaxID=3155391 RepID=UPI0033F2434F